MVWACSYMHLAQKSCKSWCIVAKLFERGPVGAEQILAQTPCWIWKTLSIFCKVQPAPGRWRAETPRAATGKLAADLGLKWHGLKNITTELQHFLGFLSSYSCELNKLMFSSIFILSSREQNRNCLFFLYMYFLMSQIHCFGWKAYSKIQNS